jgi:hypothetical protein
MRLAIIASLAILAAPGASALSASEMSGSWSLGADGRSGALFTCASPIRLAPGEGGLALTAPGWTETFSWTDTGETVGVLKPTARSSSGYQVTRRGDGGYVWSETDAEGRLRPNIDALVARRCTQG